VKWKVSPVPDEEILFFSVRSYGIREWGSLFNSRQKLALIVFAEKIRKAYNEMIRKNYDEGYAKAVVTYLSFVLSKLADWNSSSSMWRPDHERVDHTHFVQNIAMLWDYGERNPFLGELISARAIENIIQNLEVI